MECLAIILILIVLYAIGKAFDKPHEKAPPRRSNPGYSGTTKVPNKATSRVRTGYASPRVDALSVEPESLASIRQSDLDNAIPRYFLEMLDDAHERGFRSYVESIPGWQDSSADREKASLAMKRLHEDLRKNIDINYEDPFIAGAYQILYHLSHCIMAFRAYEAIFRRIEKIPPNLLICDIAAGSDAGLAGLMLSLRKNNANPYVQYISIEKSDQMYKAGRCFHDNFNVYQNINYKRYRKFISINQKSEKQYMTIFTAFHASLEWDSKYDYNSKKEVNELIKNAMNSIPFNVYMCTCHKDKQKHLIDALNQCMYTYKQNKISMRDANNNIDYALELHRLEKLQKLHQKFGFRFPESYNYWGGSPEGDRFKNPTNAVGRYGQLTDTEVDFEPDDDLPF